MGIFGRSGPAASPIIAPDQLPVEGPTNVGKRRGLFGGGFFGEGGVGRAIAGTIGDALLRNNGSAPVYAPLMMQRQQMQMQQQNAEAERMARREDMQWEWENKPRDPVNNDTVNDFNFIRQQLGDDAANQYLRNLGDPMTTVQLPGNRVYSGPRSGMADALRGDGGSDDLTPVVEGGHAYTPGPGGRANPSNWKPAGGAPQAPRPFANPPARLKSGVMTSGRRTPEGNRLVGGVAGSKHLSGHAIDYDGPDLNAVLAEARGLPGLRKAFIHNNHVHAEGDWNVPYFGKRGTVGKR